MNQEGIKELNFEQSMQELETIVRRLEEGNVNLEDAIVLYERGCELRKLCEEKIKYAKTRVEKIIENQDGTVSTAAMDITQ